VVRVLLPRVVAADLQLEYVIPLPPLDEKRRVGERIDAIAVKIEGAMALRTSSVQETKTLMSRIASHFCNHMDWSLFLNAARLE
jgi:hypothetical protein